VRPIYGSALITTPPREPGPREELGCVYVSGIYSRPSDARVSAFDRGLLYGDGVFESFRTYGGAPFRIDRHLARLAASLDAVGIRGVPASPALADVARETVARSGLSEAYIRIAVTRGADLHGLLPRPGLPPTVIVAALPLRSFPVGLYDDGATAVLLWSRADDDEPRATVKSSSYLRGVLGRMRAADRGATEGFYLDSRGNVTEGTVSNVFAVTEGELRTPPVDVCLAGVTRAEVLALARERGLRSVEAPIPADVLLRSDEVFVTSSLAEVLPIVEVDGTSIGDRRPGPVTRRLLDAYRAEAARAGSGGSINVRRA
jgi:branched-chain amino acid aminotransferase